jgi:DNA-binding transcriptional regulator YhcF (GntR family)
LLNPDGEPADFLALVRELAWQEGMSADISSKVFEEMEKNR